MSPKTALASVFPWTWAIPQSSRVIVTSRASLFQRATSELVGDCAAVVPLASERRTMLSIVFDILNYILRRAAGKLGGILKIRRNQNTDWRFAYAPNCRK